VVLTKLFNRRWWWATILVILGMVGLVWLAFWQLDRQEQRRNYNAMVESRWRMDPVPLTAESVPNEIDELEFRRVAVSGEFDFANQIALKNQMWNEQPGIQLVTPLVIGGNQAVLVARGWLPYNQADPTEWAQFNEPAQATLVGRAHESQMMPSGEAPPIPSEPQREWFRLNIAAIQPQMPYELLPFFIYQLPEPGRTFTELPVRQNLNPLLELRDPVMHLSYAIQWFSFALILGFGYIQLVRLQERRANKRSDSSTDVVEERNGPVTMDPAEHPGL